MPAFLFPKNGQATGMSRTLCQGALKPPASPAPRLVTWSRAKAGPGRARCAGGGGGVLMAAGRMEPHRSPSLRSSPSHCRDAHPSFLLLQPGNKARGTWGGGGLLHSGLHLFRLHLKRASCPKEGVPTLVAAVSLMSRDWAGGWIPCERWGPRAGPPCAFFVQAPRGWGYSAQQYERCGPPTRCKQWSGRAVPRCRAPSLSFPGLTGHRPAPIDNFFPARKSPEQLGSRERLREETPSVWRCTRGTVYARGRGGAARGKMATERAGPAGRGCGGVPGAPPPPGWPPGRAA